ncbi:MAG: hypothetical protein ACLP52_07390, partial [Streptosporangiaceae bacterium]
MGLPWAASWEEKPVDILLNAFINSTLREGKMFTAVVSRPRPRFDRRSPAVQAGDVSATGEALADESNRYRSAMFLGVILYDW